MRPSSPALASGDGEAFQPAKGAATREDADNLAIAPGCMLPGSRR